MYLPDYRAKALINHLQRIVNHASCSHSDTRTVNALRLVRQDLRYLSKLLDNETTETKSAKKENIGATPR